MQYKGEYNKSQAPVNSQGSVSNQTPFYFDKHRDSDCVSSCCVENLAKLIRCEFRRGDPIGVTFIGDQVAFIFVGIFLELSGTVLVVKNLFLDRTISFIPLCDIASIEMGCALEEADSGPMLVVAQPPAEQS